MQDAIQRLSAIEVPKYLIIQLRRFKEGVSGGLEKNTVDVYPNKTVNLCVHSSNNYNITRVSYKLIGSIHHNGEFCGGHYYANVSIENNWYQCNDANVLRISHSAIDARSLYLGVYSKL